MFQRFLFLAVMLAAVGCSEKQRPITEAKPVAVDPVEKPVDVPAGTAPAASDPAAKAILTAALNAHTGNKPWLVDGLKSVKFQLRGSVIAAPDEIATNETQCRWPSDYSAKWAIGVKPPFLPGRSGTVVWTRLDEITPKTLAVGDMAKAISVDSSAEWYWLLVGIADPDLIAAPAPAITIVGKPADGVAVWSKHLPTAVIHFDREKKLMSRVTYRGREGNRDVVKEIGAFSHEAYNGVRLIDKRIIRGDGVRLAEWQIEKIEFPAKFPDKLFDGP